MGRLQRVLIVCAACMGLCTLFAFLNLYFTAFVFGRLDPIFQEAGVAAFRTNMRASPEQWDQLAAIVHEPPQGSRSPRETTEEYHWRVASEYAVPVVNATEREIWRGVLGRTQLWNGILVLALGAITITLTVCAAKADEWD